MRKICILGLISMICIGFGVIGQAYTVFTIPLPCDIPGINVLPNVPNFATVEGYDPFQKNFDTALTTDLLSWTCIKGVGGWTINKTRWVCGAGLDINECMTMMEKAGWVKTSIFDYIPLKVKILATYGLDYNLDSRSWSLMLGFDVINAQNTK